jgi:hypothetical protein
MSSPGNSELARVGVTGAVVVADVGTALPVGLAAWPAGFAVLGWISDDGLVESVNEDSTDFTPWQSNSPIRTEITKGITTYKFTAWQSSFDTVGLYYRKTADDMAVVGAGATQAIQFDVGGKPKQDLRCFGWDVIDGVYQRRMIAPSAEITDRGDLTYKSDTMISYEFTVTCYDGPNGYAVRRMISEGWDIPA